ncbi:MAG: Lrp/AsnC family transcriptional regulator [Cyclobacteriaceae bacterium]
MKLDETDIKILRYLQENGRYTTKSLADKLNLSTTPVFERVKKMEREGLIRQYVALLNERKIGLKQTVFISISLKEHTRSYLDKFIAEIDQYDEVLECYHVAGDYDFLLKVVVEDVEAYEKFILTKLSVISNIGKVQTHIALSRKKHTTALKLNGLKK